MDDGSVTYFLLLKLCRNLNYGYLLTCPLIYIYILLLNVVLITVL
jgi:hypothetical protein